VEPDAPRTEALAVATRALARREHSQRSLRERLQRAGVAADEAEAVVEELRHAGLVDDTRYAEERARVLAERGKGDAAIRFELERAGVDTAAIEAALGGLEPERERAAALVARRGASPATARLLASRGFGEEVVTALVAAEW
jgi:regulatory protein